MAGRCIEKVTHDKCGKNNLQIFLNDDNSYTGFCFSCGEYIPDPFNGEEPPKKIKNTKPKEIKLDDYVFPSRAVPERKLSLATMEYFGVGVAVSEEDGVTPIFRSYPFYTDDDLVAYKVKTYDKKFWTVGQFRQAMPFGWRQAISTGSKRLFITEGEDDACALFEALKAKARGTKWEDLDPAIISIKHGAGSAKNELSTLYPEIRKFFDEVILVFDMDEPGRAASKEASQVIPNCKIASLPSKDPNQCLIDGRALALCNAVLFKAEKSKNTRLVLGTSLIAAARQPPQWGIPWPWQGLTDLTRGMRFGETYYFGAGV